MSNCHSSMYLPASVVADACEMYLVARHRRIEHDREEAISRLMTRRIGFLGKLVGRKLLSREAAIAELKGSPRCGLSEWDMFEVYGGLWAGYVQETMVLARSFPHREMMISSELGDLLEGCWPGVKS